MNMTSMEHHLNPLSDEEIIGRILAGEKRLFELLIRKYNQRLFRIGVSILEIETEVEDAMQTAYVSAYLHLADFENRSAFGTWLVRIMLNQCYEQKRQLQRRLASPEQPEHYIIMNTPSNQLINKELGNVLEQAIAQLPDKYRLVFILREIENLSVQETSETLDIEASNVKVRLNRAKTMLRAHLHSYMQEHVYAFHLDRCNNMVSRVFRHLSIG
ncbi:sigma-70 family RNA polymerase sigma factor [Edaphocola aurantiacus]|uniref:sigma-70 family RNA polymerase sigma factor n=1 Tax=Edaphocola aurantiacus TaxID=2601682 RepID=UPI001C93DCB0|nr:sigma-70 family RNA polymerase sigma factor [Edaphocola aurantiacus]